MCRVVLGDVHVDIIDFDADTLDSAALALPVRAGDMLFFHEYLLHRSGMNQSDRARWTFSARYGDLLSKENAAQGWAYRVGEGFDLLCKSHPDKVSMKEK